MKIRTAFLPAVTLLVAGCSFSMGSDGDPRDPASKIAETASDALAEEVGAAPDDFDCGEGDVDIVEGKVIDCTLTDGGVSYPATVTISEVDGRDYRIDVEVADEPTG